MLSPRWLTKALGVVGLAAGVTLAEPWQHLAAPPTFAEALRLTGPFRGLPVPFLWSAWGASRRDYDRRAGAALGQWLTRLLPERIDLFRGFAWELVYDGLALERDPDVQARLLVDAIALLDEGAELHPESYHLPFDASFLLLDRCEGSGEKRALREAVERMTGEDVLALAASYANRAQQLAPDVELTRVRQALTRELRGLRAARTGDIVGAARHFTDSGRAWRASDSERADRLEALGRELLGGLSNLSAGLRNWLIRDARLGRNPELWRPR